MKQQRAEAAVLTERGVYAFVGWVLSIASYMVFLVWAFVPDTVLVSVGITYFPSKYAAVAIPCLMFVVAVLGTVFYIGLNMLRTPDPEDLVTPPSLLPFLPSAYHNPFHLPPTPLS